MASRRKYIWSWVRTALAVVALLALTVVSLAVFLVYGASHPPHSPFLVKPDQFTTLSSRSAKVSEELWPNRDHTVAKGWLLRGGQGKPAVILLHRFGADRSWLLNLGVKLNESTDFTVLWPDLRGHSEAPTVPFSSFGGCETDDVIDAIAYLRSLKTSEKTPLVGEQLGIYGIELGAYVGLQAAVQDSSVNVLVLDSVPASSEDMLYAAVRLRAAFDLGMLRPLARLGAATYLRSCYRNGSSCEAAGRLGDRQVLFLTGGDSLALRDSTLKTASCASTSPNVETVGNLTLTGMSLTSATSEQAEAYDRRVIDFLSTHLQPLTIGPVEVRASDSK